MSLLNYLILPALVGLSAQPLAGDAGTPAERPGISGPAQLQRSAMQPSSQNARPTSEQGAFEKRCHEEVVALHEVIEGWLAGTIANSDDAYRSFSAAMAQDFEIISPTGGRSDRDSIVSSLRAAHGSRGASFSIAIKNLRTRLLRPPLALLTYEEWQVAEGTTTARLSSVLMRQDPSKPRGVAWVHLQETWLPGLAPDS